MSNRNASSQRVRGRELGKPHYPSTYDAIDRKAEAEGLAIRMARILRPKRTWMDIRFDQEFA